MGFVLLGMLAGLIPSGVILYLLLLTMKEHRREKQKWEEERERLLNRSMTKEWASYLQMQTPTKLDSTSDYLGMSDEDELRRYGQQPVGEVLVDLGDEMKELGLIESEGY